MTFRAWIILAIVVMCPILHGQSALDFHGWLYGSSLRHLSAAGVESGNYLASETPDISISASFGSELSSPVYNSINFLSLAKRFNRHYFYLRYTPGSIREFRFSSSSSLTGVDSINSALQNDLTYNEIAAFAYGYSFSKSLSAGLNVRYFTEKFSNDVLGVVFTSDTLYLFRDNESQSTSLIKGDIGMSYKLRDNLRLSLMTNNLFANESGVISETNKDYLLRKEKSITISGDYNFYKNYNLHSAIETNGFYSAGVSGNYNLAGADIYFGLGFFDFVNGRRLSGIMPSVSVAIYDFGITISAVKYFNRTSAASLSDFTSIGISNLNYNSYSSDKISAGINYEISSFTPKYASIIEIKILKNIYTGLGDMYSTEPFAEAKVFNSSQAVITLRPSSKVEGINESEVYSNLTEVQPGDTAIVKFYTIVNERPANSAPRITSAEFFIYTMNDKPDDKRSIPVIVYGKNAWDGSVGTLRNFATADFDFSVALSRQIISGHKNEMDTIPAELGNFYILKQLYDEAVKQLVYVADPNAITDRVQYPNETYKLKGGDCDDLSVLFSSLFESAGIETAFVDYKSDSGAAHVNLLVNTGVSASFAANVSENDKKYYIRKDISGRETVWLPLETTILTGFEDAWNSGALRFYNEAVVGYGLLKNKVEIFEVY